jgi:hypothetical protein
LDLCIEPTIPATVSDVKHQVRNYADYFRAKTVTGINRLNKFIVSAFIKSMLCCFLPPLVAIEAITNTEVSQIVASLGKTAAGIQNSVPNRVYNSLNQGGPNWTIAQVLAEGTKL